ncbi:hypothetical protein [Photobacterium sanguinicancri]|uniref:hypothetical protein n=1 Tax=Photobacterium sanguinicancri TaxID=875932 RepID=UPI0026E3D182|nr:hypothetical protein [Photobacterium sanguinicancri]MDO6497320.1 hypothetical protein [Photobacterium sanguinicancri]
MTSVSGLAYCISKPFTSEKFPSPPLPVPTSLVMTPSVMAVVVKTLPAAWVAPVPDGTSVIKAGFWDREYKNNLFVKPRSVELGLVVSPSKVPVEMWSSYTAPLALNEIVKKNDKGLRLGGVDAGDVLPPFGGIWRLTLDVSMDVELEVAASFEFSFNKGTVKYNLTVTGTKVALWPYQPIYPIGEEWQWFTSIIETHANEQRLSNASKPIQSLNYRYNLPVRAASEQLARYEAQGLSHHVVPVWSDATAPVSVKKGDKAIIADVRWRNFNEDDMLIIYKSASEFEVSFVESRSDSELILKRPILFERVNAVVMPVVAAIAPEGLKSVRRGTRTEQQITWQNSEPLHIPPATVLPVEFGLEYLERPVVAKRGKGDGVRDDMQFTFRDKTTSSGQQLIVPARDIGHHATSVEFIASSRESSWQLRQFLYLFKGRLNTAWWVSFSNEIRIAASCNRQRIVVEPIGLNQFGGRHVYLKWHDGLQMVFAKPIGFDDDGNEILNIGGDAKIPVDPEDLTAGHIMRLMRADDDKVKMQYQPKHIMKANLPMKEVPLD